MLKFVAIAFVAAGLAFSVHGTAEAAGQGCSCHSAPVSYAPATAQARTNAYRSYSYEPGATESPVYRSAPMYRSRSNVPTYLQGGSKALGRY